MPSRRLGQGADGTLPSAQQNSCRREKRGWEEEEFLAGQLTLAPHGPGPDASRCPSLARRLKMNNGEIHLVSRAQAGSTLTFPARPCGQPQHVADADTCRVSMTICHGPLQQRQSRSVAPGQVTSGRADNKWPSATAGSMEMHAFIART